MCIGDAIMVYHAGSSKNGNHHVENKSKATVIQTFARRDEDDMSCDESKRHGHFNDR